MESEHLSPTKLAELHNLKDNWDGYNGLASDTIIIDKVEEFIKNLPQKYLDSLSEDGIFPNPHGTISVEWRKGYNVVSIEFGKTTSSFYSVLDGNNESEEDMSDILASKKLINVLDAIIKS